jgi:hypothetical protein
MTYMPNQMNPTTETTHKGNIDRLPRNLRDDLNLRLEIAEPSGSILAWLNALPEALAVLASRLGGSQTSEQNLTNWRKGGCQDWLNPGSRLIKVNQGKSR